MANVTDFTMRLSGPEAALADIKAFLLTALESCAGYYGDYTLDCIKLFPDLDKDHDHTFLGLDNYCVNAENEGVVEENCFFISPDRKRLSLHGATKWMPPVMFAERLSRKYPDVDILLDGTTEHELDETWKVRNGVAELWELTTTDVRADTKTVHVKEGVQLTPLPSWFCPQSSE